MADTGTLAGQAILVTGGASGIGKATCIRLARAGARVAVADINEAAIQQTLGELKPADALGVRVDVRSEDEVNAAVQKIVDAWGRIDVLVHSAGVLRAKDSGPRMLHQVEKQECDFVLDVNLKGTFLVNKAVMAIMSRQKSGLIINVSSTSGLRARAFDSIYSASKFGVNGLTEALAEEARKYNVRVCSVMPDAIATPLWDQNGPIQAPEYCIPPERVAQVIEFLAALPPDTVMENVVVSAFRGRKARPPAAPAPDAAR